VRSLSWLSGDIAPVGMHFLSEALSKVWPTFFLAFTTKIFPWLKLSLIRSIVLGDELAGQ
jgi:hypothetical protein